MAADNAGATASMAIRRRLLAAGLVGERSPGWGGHMTVMVMAVVVMPAGGA